MSSPSLTTAPLPPAKGSSIAAIRVGRPPGACPGRLSNAIAIADGARGGEVRFLGEVDASEEGMRRVVKRIAAKHSRVQFCYEAGHRIERFFNRVKNSRRVATRYDKLIESFAAFVL